MKGSFMSSEEWGTLEQDQNHNQKIGVEDIELNVGDCVSLALSMSICIANFFRSFYRSPKGIYVLSDTQLSLSPCVWPKADSSFEEMLSQL